SAGTPARSASAGESATRNRATSRWTGRSSTATTARTHRAAARPIGRPRARPVRGAAPPRTASSSATSPSPSVHSTATPAVARGRNRTSGPGTSPGGRAECRVVETVEESGSVSSARVSSPRARSTEVAVRPSAVVARRTSTTTAAASSEETTTPANSAICAAISAASERRAATSSTPCPSVSSTSAAASTTTARATGRRPEARGGEGVAAGEAGALIGGLLSEGGRHGAGRAAGGQRVGATRRSWVDPAARAGVSVDPGPTWDHGAVTPPSAETPAPAPPADAASPGADCGFEVLARHGGKARAGVISTPHGPIATPAFVPVGTKATVKAVLPESMSDLGAQARLATADDLDLQPGHDLVDEAGGLGRFMNWPGPTYTDSGGFQVMSLGAGFQKVLSSEFSGGAKARTANGEDDAVR